MFIISDNKRRKTSIGCAFNSSNHACLVNNSSAHCESFLSPDAEGGASAAGHPKGAPEAPKSDILEEGGFSENRHHSRTEWVNRKGPVSKRTPIPIHPFRTRGGTIIANSTVLQNDDFRSDFAASSGDLGTTEAEANTGWRGNPPSTSVGLGPSAPGATGTSSSSTCPPSSIPFHGNFSGCSNNAQALFATKGRQHTLSLSRSSPAFRRLGRILLKNHVAG